MRGVQGEGISLAHHGVLVDTDERLHHLLREENLAAPCDALIAFPSGIYMYVSMVRALGEAG